MELLDIQKEIRKLVTPHHLVEGIEDEIELKNAYFEKDEELPSNVRPRPVTDEFRRILNFAHHLDCDGLGSGFDHNGNEAITVTRDECTGLINHILDLYRMLEYFNKDGVDFDRYVFTDEDGLLWVKDRADRDSGSYIQDAEGCMDTTYLTKRYFEEVERHWRAGNLNLSNQSLTDREKSIF